MAGSRVRRWSCLSAAALQLALLIQVAPARAASALAAWALKEDGTLEEISRKWFDSDITTAASAQ